MEYVPKCNMYIACPLQIKHGFYGTSFILIVNRSPLMLFIDVELTSFFYLPIRSLGLWVSKTVMENNMESSFAVDTNTAAVTAPY